MEPVTPMFVVRLTLVVVSVFVVAHLLRSLIRGLWARYRIRCRLREIRDEAERHRS